MCSKIERHHHRKGHGGARTKLRSTSSNTTTMTPHHTMPESTTPQIVNMLGDVIYLEINGVHQDWKSYRFELDIETPGKKVNHFYD